MESAVLRDRNAVRAEHGLSPLGAPAEKWPPSTGAKPPLWRRLLSRW